MEELLELPETQEELLSTEDTPQEEKVEPAATDFEIVGRSKIVQNIAFFLREKIKRTGVPATLSTPTYISTEGRFSPECHITLTTEQAISLVSIQEILCNAEVDEIVEVSIAN